MGPHTTAPGARASHKLRTRQELLRRGLDLFLDRGYGRTTIGDVAREAGVSERTFFRYFASKEELVLHPVQEITDHFLTEAERRPEHEPPLTVLREAGARVMEITAAESLETVLPALRLVCVEPELRAAQMVHSAAAHQRMAAVLARRERTAPGDLRPSLLVGAYVVASALAAQDWTRRGDGSLVALQRATDDHLRQMPAALAERWSG
ncbi:Putative mycofactocin biosynthesis transcriptional regulator MftR [Streptomyces sp. enrichment culture]|jgi:AcrR family transcriptional regulator|uniref:TetR family transcriptional regulator n=1 Tax=Streptomyces xiamenensis TaxID=408015 RepID=UPI0037CF2664